MIYLILYMAIAAVATFGLLVAATRYANLDWEWGFPAGYVICGVLWPLCLPFAAAYIAAKWFIENSR